MFYDDKHDGLFDGDFAYDSEAGTATDVAEGLQELFVEELPESADDEDVHAQAVEDAEARANSNTDAGDTEQPDEEPHTNVVVAYSDTQPRYPLLRVMACMSEMIHMPDNDLGCYPLAIMKRNAFIKGATSFSLDGIQKAIDDNETKRLERVRFRYLTPAHTD